MRKNIVFHVTRKYMMRNKGRTFTTFAGIVFMVLLMTCVFVGKDTGIRYLEDVASLKDGKWHVSMYDITEKEYEQVLEVPGVKETVFPFQGITLKYGETKDVPEDFPYFGENTSFRENRQYTGQEKIYEVTGIMETPSYERMGAAGYTAITLLDESQMADLDTFNLSLILDVEKNPNFDIASLVTIAGDHEFEVNDYLLAFSASTSDTIGQQKPFLIS